MSNDDSLTAKMQMSYQAVSETNPNPDFGDVVDDFKNRRPREYREPVEAALRSYWIARFKAQLKPVRLVESVKSSQQLLKLEYFGFGGSMPSVINVPNGERKVHPKPLEKCTPDDIDLRRKLFREQRKADEAAERELDEVWACCQRNKIPHDMVIEDWVEKSWKTISKAERDLLRGTKAAK